MSQSSVLYDAQLGPGYLLRQIRSANFSPNTTLAPDYTSGGVDPAAIFVLESRPEVRFTSGDIGGALAGIDPVSGLHIANGTATIQIPWNHRANGGTFQAGASHARLVADRGLFVPASLTANQSDQDGASIEILGQFYSTDETPPVQAQLNQSLPASVYNGSYRLGPIYIGSTPLTGIVGVTINFGITLEPELLDGLPWPSNIYITRRNPTAQIRFRDLDQMLQFGALFSALNSATIFLRRRAAGGTYLADAALSHVKLTLGSGTIVPDSIGASGNAAAEPSITLTGVSLTSAEDVAIEPPV